MRRTGSIGEATLDAARQELERLANTVDGMTKQQAVKRLGKSIRAAREKGVGLEQIAEALTKSGIPIGESTLKGYLSRGSGGGARTAGAGRTPDATASSEPPPEGTDERSTTESAPEGDAPRIEDRGGMEPAEPSAGGRPVADAGPRRPRSKRPDDGHAS